MTRAGTGCGVVRGGLCELAGGGVDGEDADEVGTQIRDEDEGVRGIDDGFVGMGGILTIGIGPWLG